MQLQPLVNMAESIAYTLYRSRRKTLSLEIDRQGAVIVRAPERLPQREIQAFVDSHRSWIQIHREKQQRRLAAQTFSPEEEARLRRLAQEILPGKTAYFAQKMGLYPTSVKITSAKTRFGSCSGKNGICYSWRLMAYPEAAIDYVVVHELAHIRHKNHGKDFYALIGQYLPDYRERIRLLKEI